MLQVVNPDTEEVCRVNVVGEIRAKTQYLAIGYLKNKEKYNTSFDSDGFFKTGDLGYFDEQLEMHYVDRIKALIKYARYELSYLDKRIKMSVTSY